MATVVIQVGRNIGRMPMNAMRWKLFAHGVQFVLSDAGAQILSKAHGRGEWDGLGEDTFVVAAKVSTEAIERLEAELADIGSLYGQAAIGFILDLRDETVIFVKPRLIEQLGDAS